MQTFVPHTLYVVGTPLGNLDELSCRAAACLSAATHVYAEDTRVTKKLLSHLKTSTRLSRADEFVLPNLIPHIIAELTQTEEVVAYVSDAGMPAISDPGQPLIDAAQNAGVRVEVISGPVAAINALVASGFRTSEFTFVGFLPRKKRERSQKLQQLIQEGRTFVLYESPKRVVNTVAELAELAPSARIALARELTKLHEELKRAPAESLACDLKQGGDIKGECVLVVEPSSETRSAAPEQDTLTLAEALTKAGVKPTQAAKVLAETANLSRDAAYDLLLGMPKK